MKLKPHSRSVGRRTGLSSRPLPTILVGLAIAMAAAGYATAAEAAWYVNGILVSNVCRAPSGAFWVYPAEFAQPVGTSCRIYATGELGIVTAN